MSDMDNPDAAGADSEDARSPTLSADHFREEITSTLPRRFRSPWIPSSPDPTTAESNSGAQSFASKSPSWAESLMNGGLEQLRPSSIVFHQSSVIPSASSSTAGAFERFKKRQQRHVSFTETGPSTTSPIVASATEVSGEPASEPRDPAEPHGQGQELHMEFDFSRTHSDLDPPDPVGCRVKVGASFGRTPLETRGENKRPAGDQVANQSLQGSFNLPYHKRLRSDPGPMNRPDSSHQPLPASGSSELPEKCSREVGAGADRESTSEDSGLYRTIQRRAITPTIQEKVNADQNQVSSREPTIETQVTASTSISRMTDIAAMFNTESRAASLANNYHVLAYSGALGDGTLYPSSNRRFVTDPDPEHESHPTPVRTLMGDNSDGEQLFPRSEPVVTTGLGNGTRAITATLVGEGVVAGWRPGVRWQRSASTVKYLILPLLPSHTHSS